MGEAFNAGNEPWTTSFEKEISDWGEETSEYVLAHILKEFLLSDGDSTAAETASRIAGVYDEDYLPSDPLMKYEDDKGMGGFLSDFYDVIFTLARLLPYHSSNQDKVVRVMVELRKLPPRPFKIWEVSHVLLPAVVTPLWILTPPTAKLPRVDPRTSVQGVDGGQLEPELS